MSAENITVMEEVVPTPSIRPGTVVMGLVCSTLGSVVVAAGPVVKVSTQGAPVDQAGGLARGARDGRRVDRVGGEGGRCWRG